MSLDLNEATTKIAELLWRDANPESPISQCDAWDYCRAQARDVMKVLAPLTTELEQAHSLIYELRAALAAVEQDRDRWRDRCDGQAWRVLEEDRDSMIPVTEFVKARLIAPGGDDDADALLAAVERLEQDRDRLARDSKILNAIGFAAAIAIGLVLAGVDEILADPIDQIQRLLDLANPNWVGEENLTRAHAHLAQAAAAIAAEHGGTEKS